MRVGIVGLQHESNTFMPRPTTVGDFRRHTVARGAAVAEQFAGGHHEIAGFFAGLAREGIEAVPIFAARATPGGTVLAGAYDELLGMMLDDLAQAGPLDGVLVAPHGAGVSAYHRDMDGYWLGLVRQRVGAAVPIVATLDPHANLTPRMVAACDAMIAYRSNPHLDQRERGQEAARLMAWTLRGEVRPTQAAAYPPVAINIERQLTGDSPCRELYALADEILARPGVLSDSVLLGFPYADVGEMGSSLVVVTDNDPDLARRCADELAGYLWEHRHEFDAQLVSPEEAVERAARSPGPVCLLDMGDNVGGGGPGDGTVLAHALHRRAGTVRAFACLFDPPAVAAAEAAGTGARLTLAMGGNTDGRHGPPLTAEVTVVSLHDGRFTEPEARHGGNGVYDMGRTAVVHTDGGLTLQLTSRRAMPSSLNQILSCGLDPAAFDVIVVKGVHAPVAAYAPVCPTLIRVNTPGITTADMTALPYHHRRRPLFPFEPYATWAG